MALPWPLWTRNTPSVRLRVGNTYSRLPEDEAPFAKTRLADPIRKVHSWELYVQPCEDVFPSPVVGVMFDLGKSFVPRQYTHLLSDSQGRFVTKQTSYGAFRAVIVVTLLDGSKHTINHDLHLAPGGAQQDVTLQLNYPGKRVGPMHLPFPSFTFGCEFELTTPLRDGWGTPRTHAQLASELQHQGRNVLFVQGQERNVHQRQAWKIVTDSSISCSIRQGPDGCLTYELVSPILQNAGGLRELEMMLECVHQNFEPQVNRTAGFHVHVGFPDPAARLTELKVVCANFVKYEDAMDLFMPESRRHDGNQFCRSHKIVGYTNKQMVDTILAAESLHSLVAFFNPSGRYHKLNLQNLLGDSPTLEFRQHSATYNAEKAIMWVRLCMEFVHACIRGRTPGSFKGNTPPEEKLERLFEWVVKDPKLRDYFMQRAQVLPRELPACGCHDASTGHSGGMCIKCP